MGEINLSNSKGRDAVVATSSVRKATRVRYLDEQGRQAGTARVIKATLTHDLAALEKSAGGLDKVASQLVHADPEIDLELFGKTLKETSRVFIDPEGKIVHKVKQIEILRNPDGSEKERRPRKTTPPNVKETPLKWSGKLMKKSQVYNKFVFASKMQITHINGLTYDFLYGIAKELEEKDSLMLLGAGPKSSEPLVFQRGGNAYRGFLEGRTQGDKYCLVVHLSNQELKTPAALPAEPKE